MSPLRVTGDAVTGVAFHSTKRSSLNFQQLPRRNGSAFFKISKNRATSQGIPKSSKFFQLCSQKIWNFWLNGLHFGNSRGFLWNLERAYSLWCACGRQVKKQEVGQRTPPSLPLWSFSHAYHVYHTFRSSCSLNFSHPPKLHNPRIWWNLRRWLKLSLVFSVLLCLHKKKKDATTNRKC